MPFEDDDIRWLLDALEEHGLQEIEVAEGDLRVRVSAVGQVVAQLPAPLQAAAPSAPAGTAQPSAPEPAAPTGVPVLSPMAGIFYRQPSPDSEQFHDEGDRVEAGDVVGLIEVMKLFNEITAPVSGVISKFAVENQERVEADQPLLYISPASRKE
ncbi:MAG: acetyl-CoA carboxylase [Armatimonadota bacterium]